MAATADQVAELRRMVDEPKFTSSYDDTLIEGYIERYPCLDERGQAPYTWLLTTPPTQEANASWIPTYDMHAAAADVWTEKAAALAGKFDLSADGANMQRSQLYAQAMNQARYHRSRRRIGTVKSYKWPSEETSTVIFNAIGDD